MLYYDSCLCEAPPPFPTRRSSDRGGYSGHGVLAANLAGRTLADLVAGDSTELTALPWVGYHSRAWEPEPARRRSEEHTSELQSRFDLVCRLLLEKEKNLSDRYREF